MINKTTVKSVISAAKKGNFEKITICLTELATSTNQLYFQVAKELWNSGGEKQCRACLKYMRENDASKKIINALGNSISAIKRAVKNEINYNEYKETNTLKKACQNKEGKGKKESGKKESGKKESGKKESGKGKEKAKGVKVHPKTQIKRLFKSLSESEKKEVLAELQKLV